MAKVKKAEYFGLAIRKGIRAGDEILSFNGRKLTDILDYVYADGQEEILVTVQKPDGAVRDILIRKKDPRSTLGLEFDDSLDISPRCCRNNCVFCFIDQLPKNLRETLYVKDDDYRLSFISGTYITGTNLTEKDMERIIEYKLSPLYFSVHATERQAYLRIMGLPDNAPDVPALLKRLTSAGIKIHSQIVLVPGYNDGEILIKTLADLRAMGENLVTAAVVPVGLTGHREGLSPLRLLTKEEAGQAVDVIEGFEKQNPGFCFASDELYSIAGRKLPEYETYGAFDQLENGVGLVAKFLRELEEAADAEWNEEYKKSGKPKRIAMITGVSGAPVMQKAAALIEKKFPRYRFDIYPVRNDFFGASVTVSGLVTAGDMINQLKDAGLDRYDKVLFPAAMLKEFENVFLDNVSLGDLEKALHIRLTAAENDGEYFLDAVLREE